MHSAERGSVGLVLGDSFGGGLENRWDTKVEQMFREWPLVSTHRDWFFGTPSSPGCPLSA